MPEESDSSDGVIQYSQSVQPVIDCLTSVSTVTEISDVVDSVDLLSRHFNNTDTQTWMDNFTVLAAHFFKVNADKIGRSMEKKVNNAVGVVSDYLLKRIKSEVSQSVSATDLEKHFQTMANLTWGLIMLSTDETLENEVQSELSDKIQLNLPSFIVTLEDREMETDSPTELTGVLPTDLGMRPQTDLYGAMLREILEPDHFKETALTAANLKASWNQMLKRSGSGEILLESVTRLPTVSKYFSCWDEIVKKDSPAAVLPDLSQDQVVAQAPQLLLEIQLIARAFQSNLFANPDIEKLKKLHKISMGGILSALHLAQAIGTGDPGFLATEVSDQKTVSAEVTLIQMVEKSLLVCGSVLQIARRGSRLSGGNVSNMMSSYTWTILVCLHQGMNLNSPNYLSPATVAFSSFALNLLAQLLKDVKDEGETENTEKCGELDLSANLTCSQRIKMIYSSVPIYSLFLQVAKYACMKAQQLLPAESKDQVPSLAAEVTKVIEIDTKLTLDEEEPLLGDWMCGILKPSTSTTRSQSPIQDLGINLGDERRRSRDLASKPNSYISLVSQILSWLAAQIDPAVLEQPGWMSQFAKAAVNKEFTEVVGSFIRIIDNQALDKLSESTSADFSAALFLFVHNLISCVKSSSQLSNHLLTSLGLDPTLGPNHPWPLEVSARSLSILAQMLVLRQHAEDDNYSMKVTALFVQIWERMVNTMAEAAVGSLEGMEDGVDVNIENMDLLLLLFHQLQLMQKKQVLLHLSNSLLQVCLLKPQNCSSQYLLMFSRLCLLMDYIIRYLYEPPVSLLPHIKANLFPKSCFRLNPDYFETRGIVEDREDRPVYYQLIPHLGLSTEFPKLDGLATSFLLTSPDSIDYPAMYEALVERLDILQAKPAADADTARFGKTTTYSFQVLWRLLQSLPPPAQFLQKLEAAATGKDTEQKFSFGVILHSLVIGPRTGHKQFSVYFKDYLVKQGVKQANAEALVSAVSVNVNTIGFEMTFLKSYLAGFEQKMSSEPGYVPELYDLIIIDAMIASFQVSIDKIFSSSNISTLSETLMEDLKREDFVGTLPQCVEYVQQLVPSIARLITLLTEACTNMVLRKYQELDTTGVSPSATIINALCVSGSRCKTTETLSKQIRSHLPGPLQESLEHWSSVLTSAFPPPSGWKDQYDKDTIPGESYMVAILQAHVQSLMKQDNIPAASLKHLLSCTVRFASDLFVWCSETGSHRTRLLTAMYPLTLAAATENLSDLVTLSLERYVGPADNSKSLSSLLVFILRHSYAIITDRNTAQPDSSVNLIPQEVIEYLEKILQTETGRQVTCKVFSGDCEVSGIPKLTEILLSLSSAELNSKYAAGVLRYFNSLFQAAERYKEEKEVQELCSQLSGLLRVPTQRLVDWLRYLVIGMFNGEDESNIDEFMENKILIQNLTQHIVKESCGVSSEVAMTVLVLLCPVATELLSSTSGHSVGFVDLLSILTTLASTGKGHIVLFRSVLEWLEDVKKYLLQKNVLEKLECGNTVGRHVNMLENATSLLGYVNNIVMALKYGSQHWGLPALDRTSSPVDVDMIDDMSWTDDMQGDEEESADESEDETLDNKLCTYTQTAKVFMNQHWYHCHTCGLTDRAGCCSVCARVCHRDHDVTYSKHGSFFCDCGAKEDGSCRAIVPRTSSNNESKRSQQPAYSGIESFKLRSSSPMQERSDQSKEKISNAQLELVRQIDAHKDQLIQILKSTNCIPILLEMTESLVPVLESSARSVAPLGAMSRLRNAIQTLHQNEKAFDMSDRLLLPTLGSQEGAFENVKMNFIGEQGQTIRQLLNAHMIRRGIMCCLNSSGSKKQHLAVSHEKGKITVLQLSALLKQADSSQKKLTLTRVASAPIPFTVLSVVANPINENFLAICGLKDCRVLTFNSSGFVAEQIILQPQLESANYIIKPIWLPGQQTQLAIVTADYVKIYDLHADVLSPSYYFLIPSGKIRDTTFVYTANGEMYLLLMSSAGHIYFQLLCDDSSARHGSFYVTNIMDVHHPEVEDVKGSLCGGGASIYFSHTLQMLFFSYNQGKSFMTSITSVTEELNNVFHIKFKPSTTNGSKNNGLQALCSWSEVPGHPGLVSAFLQTSGNPVIFMVEPEKCTIQEIKMGNKSKIMDMVSIRHTSSSSSSSQGEEKTTFILLCEDGSLKIYMADNENTGFWLKSTFQPTGSLVFSGPQKKKKKGKVARNSGLLNFSTDFFEHCQHQVTDIEFGGQDCLQIYNVQQIKLRLQNNNLYIANTKPGGFQLDVTNHDANTVVVGIRVLLGSQNIDRVPSSIEICGRTLQTHPYRSRWFELPLTREESIHCNNKLTINFGPTMDPDGVSMIDSVQVWTKSKEAFGWPDDNEDISPTISSEMPSELDQVPVQPIELTQVDKIVISSLETLDSTISICGDGSALSETEHKEALDVSTRLLVAPGSPLVQKAAKYVLNSLHPNKVMCYLHSDGALLKHATSLLSDSDDIDVEHYHHVVAIIRSIAASRPKNLVKFAETNYLARSEESLESKRSDSKGKMTDGQKFIDILVNTFWRLFKEIPSNCLTGVMGQQGLTFIEATVQSLIEILHAFGFIDLNYAQHISDYYIKFLLCPDERVAYSARGAIVRVLRPRIKKKRTAQDSKAAEESKDQEAKSSEPSTSRQNQNAGELRRPSNNPVAQQFQAVAAPGNENDRFNMNNEADLNRGPGGIHLGGVAGNLDELIPIQGGNLPAMLDLPPDEAMVELAIALSLQDQEGGEGNQLAQGLQGLHQLANLGEEFAGLLGGQDTESDGEDVVEVDEDYEEDDDDEEEVQVVDENAQFSDTTASAPGSDDEGSLGGDQEVATRDAGATGVGSDSGGSLIDMASVENLPPGSFGYETHADRTTTDSDAQIEDMDDAYRENSISGLRQLLIENLISSIHSLREVGGKCCVPFMQVILALSAELDHENDRDLAAIKSLLHAVVNEIGIGTVNNEEVSVRDKKKEFQLLILRMLSVLMSRTRLTENKPNSSDENFLCQTVASYLAEAGVHTHCLAIVKGMLPYWQGLPVEETVYFCNCELLKPLPVNPLPDMAPFFLKQYVKTHSNDVFEAYTQLLTEMALRIPYQMKKVCDSNSDTTPHFDHDWFYQLCELMMTPQAPFVKRQVRKLLLLISGSKEQYRQLRDMHTLETRIREIRNMVAKSGFDIKERKGRPINLPYDSLIQLIELLKTCVEVAEGRTLNWQKYCTTDETVLPFLLQISYLVDNGVAPLVLQLLQSALCSFTKEKGKSKSSSPMKTTRKDKLRSEEPEDEGSEVQCNSDESLRVALTHQVLKWILPSLGGLTVSCDNSCLAGFVDKFLLECNTTSVRWQAHTLSVALYSQAESQEKTKILDVLWSLWPKVSDHGQRAAQFVDILGYFSVLECREENTSALNSYSLMAVSMLKNQNKILSSHANSSIYTSLAQLVDFTGFYLESDPCLVCNNPEVSFSPLKLSNLKMDTKYTTSTQMVKLTASHSISKIILRIGDVKREKMVRTINIYYNNRSVAAVVDLKNRVTTWHLAKKINLTAGQTDVKIEFPLPIVACNLMIEYADFYENIQGAGETLQCPRCSASVPVNPGVCNNCGENVFQCHKCRTINYDEKDPFLCNSCGFCKYAKFEYTVTCRPCCAVDPVESEEDRNKALSSINTLLEKADKVYRQLIANKPELESLLLAVQDGWTPDSEDSHPKNISPVNRYIHQLSQKYCVDCKNLFEELSKLIQRVMATRMELVAYDRSRRQDGEGGNVATPQVERKLSCSIDGRGVAGGNGCYGCAAACVEHCLTLLKALATKQLTRALLHNQGLVTELLNNNMRGGTNSTRSSVQGLICLLTKNNVAATEQLNTLLYNKINAALQGSDQVLGSVRYEMTLLATVSKQKDSCWETRLKTLVKLFLKAAKKGNSPAVMDSISLPCLNMIQDILQSFKGKSVSPRRGKEKSSSPGDLDSDDRPVVDVRAWLAGDITYSDWKKELDVQDSKRIMAKYFHRWKTQLQEKKWQGMQATGILDQTYLKQILFNKSCRVAREVTANLLSKFIEAGPQARRRHIVDTLTSFLGEVGKAGEASAEFIKLYKKIVEGGDWHYYLAVKGVLKQLASLIEAEINYFGLLEQSRLSSDLSLGFAVKELTSLLSSLLHHARIKAVYKSRLVSSVLGGYLSLKRLVIQRTKMVDETQESLLGLLEDLTSGTAEETQEFIRICVDTVKRYPAGDHLTPVFIFERLCSIVYPEETETGEFYLSLEKDPQQEEFLQGRMLGNPYSSKEPGLGPLMRDVKNKICTDCELVALLEDDNGMELLVNNKIISLDLPVKDVYNKVWLPEAGESEAMRVIYRMRGLLGDATEEFIESLDKKEGEQSDDEELFKLAAVVGECGGLSVMLDKLTTIRSLSSKPLLIVILKLFGYCCKLSANRKRLLEPGLNTSGVLLRCLQLCLSAGETQTTVAPGQPSLTETVLELLERLLVEAAAVLKSVEAYQGFATTTVQEITSLLDHAVHMRPGTDLHHRLMRVLPFLTYTNQSNMGLLINHFDAVLNFTKFDEGHSVEEEARLEAWVALCDGIERNELGNTMKNEIVSLGIVSRCTNYIKEKAPPGKQILLKQADNPAWKEFSMKPSIKYILRALAGLAANHAPTQKEIANSVINELHLLEQMSSDEHLGSLAEAVLEAVRESPDVGNKVDDVRSTTREEKKKLAMAMRAKQLKSIGLKTNDKGQVKAENSLLQQFQTIGEESGLSCVICREGYRFQPTKVLAIYTFTRRCALEETERGMRKTMGFSTVSHFNLVHVDCHMAAVRQARSREEWESALLQNANTRCNGLLPLWGPSVTESAFAACLARHNAYLSDVTGQRDISYQNLIHDMKLMLLKFAEEKSFSVDSGGGGPQSNLHTLPYLAHVALYTINSSRASAREERSLETWLESPPSQWCSQATAVDGPFYQATAAMLLFSPDKWNSKRAHILQRLLLTAHVRSAAGTEGGDTSGPPRLEVGEYSVYRGALMFFSLVDIIIKDMWAGVHTKPDQDWCVSLAEWIRHNDECLTTRSASILSTFQDDLIQAQDIGEVLDVCGLLAEIPSGPSAILEIISQIPALS